MRVTEVRVKLRSPSEPSDRLLAYAIVTLDGCFVLHDVKIVQGEAGPFVAMPSRKAIRRCRRCRWKCELRANFCAHCGHDLNLDPPDGPSPAKSYYDVAHPVTPEFRQHVNAEVLRVYREELARPQDPDCYGVDLDEYERRVD